MPRSTKTLILIAEDSQFDQMILKRAFTAGGIQAELTFVSDGEDLLAYLGRLTPGADGAGQTSARPELILMDLHMPRMGGREALKRIRQTDDLKHLPVVMLTTSDSEEHIKEFHALGANSYLVKPNSFDSLVLLVKGLAEYWFGTASLPAAD